MKKITLAKIIKVKILINIITFYVLNLNILFLLFLGDINRLKIKFNNLENIFIQKKKENTYYSQMRTFIDTFKF